MTRLNVRSSSIVAGKDYWWRCDLWGLQGEVVGRVHLGGLRPCSGNTSRRLSLFVCICRATAGPPGLWNSSSQALNVFLGPKVQWLLAILNQQMFPLNETHYSAIYFFTGILMPFFSLHSVFSQPKAKLRASYCAARLCIRSVVINLCCHYPVFQHPGEGRVVFWLIPQVSVLWFWKRRSLEKDIALLVG